MYINSLVLANELPRLRITNILQLAPPLSESNTSERSNCPLKGHHVGLMWMFEQKTRDGGRPSAALRSRGIDAGNN